MINNKERDNKMAMAVKEFEQLQALLKLRCNITGLKTKIMSTIHLIDKAFKQVDFEKSTTCYETVELKVDEFSKDELSLIDYYCSSSSEYKDFAKNSVNIDTEALIRYERWEKAGK